jgi:hypothetical protein
MNFKMEHKYSNGTISTSTANNINIVDGECHLGLKCKLGDKIIAVTATGTIDFGYFVGVTKGGYNAYLSVESPFYSTQYLINNNRFKLIKANWEEGYKTSLIAGALEIIEQIRINHSCNKKTMFFKTYLENQNETV